MGSGFLIELLIFGGMVFVRRKLMAVQQGHRKRIEAAGYRERNSGRRLRGERYWRWWFYIYAVMNLLTFCLAQLLSRGNGGLAAPIVGMLFPVIPSLILAGVICVIAELFHPTGDVFQDIVAQEFVPVAKVTQPLGSSRFYKPGELNALGQGSLEELPAAKPEKEERHAQKVSS